MMHKQYNKQWDFAFNKTNRLVFYESSDVASNTPATAEQYNQLRADMIALTFPNQIYSPYILPSGGNVTSSERIKTYTDDLDYLVYRDYNSGFGVENSSGLSGNLYEKYDMTSDWADVYLCVGVAKIGDYIYACGVDNDTEENRVYRYDKDDISAGGTLMTGAGFGTTIEIESMISDGTYLYFNNEGGDTISSNHIWNKYSLSGTVLTYVETITCGSDSTNFSGGAGVNNDGDIYGMKSSYIRKYNSSGVLQLTTTKPLVSSTYLGVNRVGHIYTVFTTGSGSDDSAKYVKVTI